MRSGNDALVDICQVRHGRSYPDTENQKKTAQSALLYG